jgi:hypothetical protein
VDCVALLLKRAGRWRRSRKLFTFDDSTLEQQIIAGGNCQDPSCRQGWAKCKCNDIAINDW